MSVKLRKKKLSSGKTSLYLDIYHEGKRHYEFLKFYLEKGSSENNKELLRLAESIRAKRQLEIQTVKHGFIPGFKKKSNFVKFFEDVVNQKSSTEKVWHGTLVHLKQFTKGIITFEEIDADWLIDFRDYLLSQINPNTAYGYFARIKNALNKAVKAGIIEQNPFNQLDKEDSIKLVES